MLMSEYDASSFFAAHPSSTPVITPLSPVMTAKLRPAQIPPSCNHGWSSNYLCWSTQKFISFYHYERRCWGCWRKGMTTRHQIDGLSDDLLYTLFARYRNRCVFLDTVCCNCTRVIEVRHLCVPGNDLTTGRHRCSVISLAAFRKCFNYYRWMRSSERDSLIIR